jgi:hypothetical protein
MDGGKHWGHLAEGWGKKGGHSWEDIRGPYPGGSGNGNIAVPRGGSGSTDDKRSTAVVYGTLIAVRTGRQKLGAVVAAAITGRNNVTSNHICVSRSSNNATKALHFPANLGIR